MKCENCGCQGIAGDLVACPMCGADLKAEARFATGGLVSNVHPLLDEPGPAPFVTQAEHGPELTDLPPGSTVMPFGGASGPELVTGEAGTVIRSVTELRAAESDEDAEDDPAGDPHG